jgi:hypothetical protein
MDRAGILLSAEQFQREGRSKRHHPSGAAGGKKIVTTDGPFAESKELIGGFVLVKVSSLEEAVRLGERYVEVVGAEETDVLPLVGD